MQFEEIPIHEIHLNPEKTSILDCELENFSSWGIQKIMYEFTIIAKDHLKRKQNFGGDKFRVIARSSNQQIKLNIKDNEDGTYLASFIPPTIGKYEIEINLIGNTSYLKKLMQIYSGKYLRFYF